MTPPPPSKKRHAPESPRDAGRRRQGRDGESPRATHDKTLCRRHHKYTARALQRPGEDSVTFRLTTPEDEAGVRPQAGGGFRATVLGLSARPAPGKAHFSVEMSLAFTGGVAESRVTSYFVDTFALETDLEKLVAKFRTFRLKVAKEWPYFATLPHISPVSLGAARPGYRLELNLPAYSGFYVSDPLFWQVLRFPPEGVAHFRDVDGASTGGRYGVTNKTARTLVYTSGDLLFNEVFSILYFAANGGQTPATDRIYVDVEYHSQWLTQTLSEEKELEPAVAAQSLARLVGAGKRTLNLKLAAANNVLTADVTTTPGKVLLRSTNFLNGGRGLKLTVRLSETLGGLLGLEKAGVSGRTFSFDAHDPHTVPLTLSRVAEKDLLAGQYPIHLVAPGQPGAVHFVHGRGWVPLLGLLADPRENRGRGVVGRVEWVDLLPGQTELQLVLLDRWGKSLVAHSVNEFVIYLELVDFF